MSAINFAYTIVYVEDVGASLDFFERAFGLTRRFLHESGAYGELETGATTLSFARHDIGQGDTRGLHSHPHFAGLRLGAVFLDYAHHLGPAVASDLDARVPHGLCPPSAG